MGASERRGFAVRGGLARLGLGEIRGDYPIMTPTTGVVAQVLRRFLVMLCIVAIVALIVTRPGHDFGGVLIVVAIVAAVYALKFGWRLLTARLGVNRCYLCRDGVAVTSRLGRIRDFVAWADVTGVKDVTIRGLAISARRVELSRNHRPKPLWFVAPQAESPLLRALLDEGRRSGALP